MEYIQQLLDLLTLHKEQIAYFIPIFLLLLLFCTILKMRKLKKKLKNSATSLDESRGLSSALYAKVDSLQKNCTAYVESIAQLKKDNAILQAKLNKVQDALDVLQKKQQATIQAKEEYWKNSHEADAQKKALIQEVDNRFHREPSALIQLRTPVFMNYSESRKFYYINKELEAPEYIQKYGKGLCVFAQVALHSIFDRTSIALEYDEKLKEDYILKLFLSKSVDVLICTSKYNEDNYCTEYTPILAIEIDGKNHEDLENQERDQIKNLLFQSVKLPLLRFSLEENKHDKVAIQQKIREILLP